jgi:hypothetical protein
MKDAVGVGGSNQQNPVPTASWGRSWSMMKKAHRHRNASKQPIVKALDVSIGKERGLDVVLGCCFDLCL